MASSTVLAISVALLVALATLTLLTAPSRRQRGELSRDTRRSDRGTSRFLPLAPQPTGREIERAAHARERSALVPAAAPPSTDVRADPETIGVTRRQFFNRSIVGLVGMGLSGFGGAVLAFLWPTLTGGFGSKVTAGRLDDILGSVRDSREPVYLSSGRFYLNPFPAASLEKARAIYPPAVMPGLEAGIVALYQKCPHLGCRVPWCATSQWFECPCHGSQYTRVGEKKAGPAPRGLDLFPVEVKGDTVTVDTGAVIQGLPIGTNVTGQEAEGPHCVSAGAE